MYGFRGPDRAYRRDRGARNEDYAPPPFGSPHPGMVSDVEESLNRPPCFGLDKGRKLVILDAFGGPPTAWAGPGRGSICVKRFTTVSTPR